jgi:nitrite reductase (NADH) small subunit
MNAPFHASEWLDVGSPDDVPLRGARVVRTPAGDVAIFRAADGVLFALRDRCPHKGGPLSQGIVHGHAVTCPLHNWVISLQSGEAQGADHGCTPTLPLLVMEGRMHLSARALHELAARQRRQTEDADALSPATECEAA